MEYKTLSRDSYNHIKQCRVGQDLYTIYYHLEEDIGSVISWHWQIDRESLSYLMISKKGFDTWLDAKADLERNL
jgi:hypothetical protein